MKIKNQKEFKIILGSLYVIAAIFLITYIIALSVKLDPTAASIAGSLGDTIGGLASPFIGTMGVILTFLAFWVQFEANQNQREDIKRERFENKFYELLRLHKENVNEIEITEAGLKGRPCFNLFLKEINALHSIIELLNPNTDSLYHLSEEEILKFSFNLFYHGVSDNNLSKFSDTNFFDNDTLARNVIEVVQAASVRWTDSYIPVFGGNKNHNKYFDQLPNLKFDYKPFQGHSANLGHYFRHLYQILKFVHLQNEIDKREKQDYIKILRAQLSSLEQAIVYLNSFWTPGQRLWYDRDVKTGYESRFIIDFQLIKNIEFHLVNFTIKPSVKFKEELQKAFPNKDERWLNETTFYAFEELENLMPY